MDIHSKLDDCFFSPLGRHIWEGCCLIFIPFRGFILSVSKPLRFSHLTLFPLSVLFHMLQWYWYFWAWIYIYSWYLETIFNFKTFLFLISIKFFSNIAVFLSFFPMELRSSISGVFKWSSMCLKGFPLCLCGKKHACNARDTGDMGSIPGSGRTPGGGNGNPTPVFLPGKFHGQRTLGGNVTEHVLCVWIGLSFALFCFLNMCAFLWHVLVFLKYIFFGCTMWLLAS